jgi:hypothetical protein
MKAMLSTINNKERFFWFIGIFLLAFHSLNQSDKISDLEVAVSHNTDFETFNLKRQVFYEMLIDSIDMQSESNEQYNELLGIVVENGY